MTDWPLLFCRNLSYDTAEDEINKVFKQYGKVVMCRLVINPDTEHSKGETTQQTQNICITFVQGWTNGEDVGSTLDKCCANILCFLTVCLFVTHLHKINHIAHFSENWIIP